MTPDPIKTAAAKPLTMAVLDCVVREHKRFNKPSICANIRGDLLYFHFTERWPHTIFKRLSELSDAGYIRKVGERKPTDRSSRAQAEWVPTGRGRAAHARWKAARKAQRRAA